MRWAGLGGCMRSTSLPTEGSYDERTGASMAPTTKMVMHTRPTMAGPLRSRR